MCSLNDACERVVNWLTNRVVSTARGDSVDALDVDPRGRFWLGRLVPELRVMQSSLGDRAERMEPCAIGFRIRPRYAPPWAIPVTLTAAVWYRTQGRSDWTKSSVVAGTRMVEIETDEIRSHDCECEQLNAAIQQQIGVDVIRTSVRVDVERGRDGDTELVITFVNVSPDESDILPDTSIYQATIGIEDFPTVPFLLESLPDSFRYDRRVAAFGLNCGVSNTDTGGLISTDVTVVDRHRPMYWSAEYATSEPDLTFNRLATDPLPPLRDLVAAHLEWGVKAWAPDRLNAIADASEWSREMREQALAAASEFQIEADRLREGLERLEQNPELLNSFMYMNAAMHRAARNRYTGWRSFQIGFMLANLMSIVNGPEESAIVDILWFATGGGKTETYLGLLVTAAFHDRLTGKITGITAWSRFPLRLLSLQQTQRFADAIAAAELVRRLSNVPGECFSLGFFVGDSSTPNRIDIDPKPGEPDRLDESMPQRFQVLIRCPFCGGNLEMGFNSRLWRLEHRCVNDDCEWPEAAIPFYIVDEEIFRFLPTVVVGTLDKVASISMQAAMRGFVASPWGVCSAEGHGYVYAPRSKRPSGCLVPGCTSQRNNLPMSASRFSPTFRLQDELHLLRDSLGAIDAHYESLLDHLTSESGGSRSKIVASSATLTGYERQCEVLYGRSGRVFPVQGPSINESFWSMPDTRLLRRFVAIAPRGATLEYAHDRIITELQQAIRELVTNTQSVCDEIGVDRTNADSLLSLYGTNVIYGNTIRDLEASVRSVETQVPISPLGTAQLTGHTPFEEVRAILNRLQSPEDTFEQRIHVIAASSMMSHGVDVDRLNSMVMLGLPLTTAEFIQATSRIGRTWPGLVLVLHKMALERDSSIHRSFTAFVEQGDRFVEAIPITRRSRRVLERTLPGIVMARIRQLHEPAAGQSLAVVAKLRQVFRNNGITAGGEVEAISRLLQLDGSSDEVLLSDVRSAIAQFFRNLNDLATNEKFPDALLANDVMRSLRDVEGQAPIFD